jgi:SEC-C motif-containing protein
LEKTQNWFNLPYLMKNVLCPCHSGSAYADCCQPFHKGGLPENALKLMRSRYSAYALCLPAYIMQTTHPANPSRDTAEWAQKILDFCRNTEFKSLEILDFQEEGSFATVTFTVGLVQNKKDASFTEKSRFEKVDGKWLYLSGQRS